MRPTVLTTLRDFQTKLANIDSFYELNEFMLEYQTYINSSDTSVVINESPSLYNKLIEINLEFEKKIK